MTRDSSIKQMGRCARRIVEDCYALDINWMIREGIFDGQDWRAGSIHWTSTVTGQEISRLRYEADLARRLIRLQYCLLRNDEGFDYTIPLVATELPWGGTRWWFTCMINQEGQACGRRVSKLYLPPGGRFYGCRLCHNLTYESCQESHRYDRLFSQLCTEGGYASELGNALLRKGRLNLRSVRQKKRNEQRRQRRKALNWA